MAGTTSINGVVSGLDTESIINKLMELERTPITRLQVKRASLNTKLSAWQEANTRMLALKTKADTLAQGSTFEAKSFTSDDDDILKGSATYSALAGTYYIKVNQLARAHQLKTDGYADTNITQVGTGTVTITVGEGAPKEITIDSSNNTLTGLRDAINRANAGVQATIINDGSETNPYRLVIASNTSGTSGEVAIDSTLTGGTSPTFSTMQAAQDASVTLGEGTGEITVTKSTNTITDLIPGVTLNLQKADLTKTVAVTIQNDNTSLKTGIQDFVNQYNNLMDYINQQFKYDTTTNAAGTLFADSSLQAILSDLTNKLFSPVSGLSQTINVLSQVGITSATSDNKLTINETDLDEALASSASDIRHLFATAGEATNSSVTYVSSTANTKISGEGGYAIEITAVATQSTMAAAIAQTDALAQDEELTLNGTTIELTAGMTPSQVLAKINEYTSTTGVIATRTTEGYLTLTSAQYGSTRKIMATSDVQGAGSSGIGTAQTRVTAGAEQTGNLAQDEELTINGIAIQLTAGMSRTQVVSKINEYTSQTGVVASRKGADGLGEGDYLTLTSIVPGSGQTITAVSTVSNGGGTPVTNTSGLGNVSVTQASPGGETGTGTGAAGTASGSLGTDVAGTINGEAATGRGQTLTGNSGNANTDGLAVSVSAQTIGSYGTVTLTKGIASLLSDYLEFVTRSDSGIIKDNKDSLEKQMEDVDDDITYLQERITAKQDQLINKFAAMESALSKLKSEGDYLAGQLTAASKGWK